MTKVELIQIFRDLETQTGATGLADAVAPLFYEAWPNFALVAEVGLPEEGVHVQAFCAETGCQYVGFVADERAEGEEEPAWVWKLAGSLSNDSVPNEVTHYRAILVDAPITL